MNRGWRSLFQIVHKFSHIRHSNQTENEFKKENGLRDGLHRGSCSDKKIGGYARFHSKNHEQRNGSTPPHLAFTKGILGIRLWLKWENNCYANLFKILSFGSIYISCFAYLRIDYARRKLPIREREPSLAALNEQ